MQNEMNLTTKEDRIVFAGDCPYLSQYIERLHVKEKTQVWSLVHGQFSACSHLIIEPSTKFSKVVEELFPFFVCSKMFHVITSFIVW